MFWFLSFLSYLVVNGENNIPVTWRLRTTFLAFIVAFWSLLDCLLHIVNKTCSSFGKCNNFPRWVKTSDSIDTFHSVTRRNKIEETKFDALPLVEEIEYYRGFRQQLQQRLRQMHDRWPLVMTWTDANTRRLVEPPTSWHCFLHCNRIDSVTRRTRRQSLSRNEMKLTKSDKEVMPFCVCLSLCQRDNSKRSERIFGGVRCVTIATAD